MTSLPTSEQPLSDKHLSTNISIIFYHFLITTTRDVQPNQAYLVLTHPLTPIAGNFLTTFYVFIIVFTVGSKLTHYDNKVPPWEITFTKCLVFFLVYHDYLLQFCGHVLLLLKTLFEVILFRQI